MGAKGILSRSSTKETKGHHNAIHELLIDCLKKRREAEDSRKRAVAKEELEEELTGSIGGESDGRSQEPVNKRVKYTEGKPLFYYVLDPEVEGDRHNGEWIWNRAGSKGLTTLYEATVNELYQKISAKIPNGRRVREIIGALQNAMPDSQIATWSDAVHLQSDDDVNTFLRLTEAKPVKLLIILHRNDVGRNTPLGRDNIEHYFPPSRFDSPEYYIDPAEDSDEEASKRAGVGK